MDPQTSAEQFFADLLADPAAAAAAAEERRRIRQFDALINRIEQRRAELGITKAELARRAGIRPEAVRRLFSMRSPNPTLTTVVALVDAVGLMVTAVERPAESAETPRRTA